MTVHIGTSGWSYDHRRGVREWEAAGREVFVYFNNDGEGRAVRNALALKAACR